MREQALHHELRGGVFGRQEGFSLPWRQPCELLERATNSFGNSELKRKLPSFFLLDLQERTVAASRAL